MLNKKIELTKDYLETLSKKELIRLVMFLEKQNNIKDNIKDTLINDSKQKQVIIDYWEERYSKLESILISVINITKECEKKYKHL